ncbi:uncharacterized protein V6R79_025579 [Siganus canaliculatus]
MAVSTIIICLLSLFGYGFSHPSPPPPRGCSANVEPPYRVLCDLESVWGVVLEAVACSGGLSSLVLAVLLLVKLPSIGDPARRSGMGPLLLLLGTLLGIFSISLAFLVGKNQALCVVRRAFWGPLFALCFSSLLVQGVRLRRLVSGKTSPSGSTLAALGLALALVQGIISAEWVLLTVVREGHPACEYPPLDFALTCSYTLGLLLIAMGLSLGVVLCGGEMVSEGAGGNEEDREGEGEKRRWKCNAVWLFLSSLASALLWVAWLGFYLYGSQAQRGKGKGERVVGGKKDVKVMDEPALSVALVIQGWILLLFHAIPETHLCLRNPPASNTQDFFDTSNTTPPPHFGDEMPAQSHRPFPENQAFSMEERSATLQTGTYHGSHGSVRPGIAFRGHVYQPTEMALVMNGGTTNQRSVAVKKMKMKMEEEVAEGNFAKKEKKLKKGQASVPKNNNDTSDDGKKEKKKKAKKVDELVINKEDESCEGGGEKKEKKKKKRICNESLNDANTDDGAVSKKKKKKQLADAENQVEPDLSEVSEEVDKKQKKKKKKAKEEEIQMTSADVESVNTEEELASNNKLQKKAKKRKSSSLSVSPEETDEQVKQKKKKKQKITDDKTTEDMDEVSVTEKAGKSKIKAAKNGAVLETPDRELGEDGEVKGKKNNRSAEIELVTKEETELKKKGKKSKKASLEVSEVEETKPKKKKKNKANSKQEEEEPSSLKSEETEEQSGDALVAEARETTSKKKKKISINVETQGDGGSVENGLKKKKKKTTNSKQEEEEPSSLKSEEAEEQSGEAVAGETTSKKKKKKKKTKVSEEQGSPQMDVVFLSEKPGNTDEVSINLERRQALQMEIDKASMPQKPAKPTGLGQWSTAQFDNKDQQQKFLRLMGGFKKGFQPAAGNTGTASMALGKDGQQKLQQGLLGEFERAQSRRMDFSNRGAGLGFTAPTNKKFSIDATTCRSVRFDD